MKYTVLSIIMLGLLQAVPASADDSSIAGSDLDSLGLGGLQAMSAEEGMQVRGRSGSSRSAAASTFSITIVDPFSGAVITQSGGQSSIATDENAGLNSTSAASSSTNAQTSGTTITITTGANVFSVTIGAISSATLGAARATVAATLVP